MKKFNLSVTLVHYALGARTTQHMHYAKCAAGSIASVVRETASICTYIPIYSFVRRKLCRVVRWRISSKTVKSSAMTTTHHRGDERAHAEIKLQYNERI